ncbi:sorting nexin-13-like [Coccinella septempunctata]|uniref:sorting nexin-13-like n=1 Tax=Coccinella septempunctata TaxID=41139 RepID=UPI001D06F768|nr:sorting nexin-13-like [Coccinella septempunctata]
MDLKSWGWIGLFAVLLISSLGLYWIFVIILCLLLFSLGFFSYMNAKLGDVDEFESRFYGNPLITENFEGGINQFTEKLDNPKYVSKSDTRVTGSDVIDSSLQEILGYIIRDYVSPWYNLISDDKEFPEVTIRKTAQTFAINISNRIKEIDWIPYLTTQLVDEAASHLRLFKQARTKMQLLSIPKTMRNSPMRDFKNSPKKSFHKRNKSETDVNWYHKRANELKNEQERLLGNSKLQNSDKRRGITLEDFFFDLELVMESNLLCRDGVCTDPDQEREYFSELTQILLYILLPDEDFQCKPLRILLREIICNVVILPLFKMLSDPDYINRIMIWLCLGEASLPSEIFLTVLRITDNCDELKSTKEIVLEEIHILRSRDSGADNETKQTLSSLLYVLKLIESRITKMDNIDLRDSYGLEYIQQDSASAIDLTLEQILKNNVALSYYLDYITSQNKQIDLFFYLNIEGWKVSVEQQLSDIHINKMKGITENIQSIYNTIRTTAQSIFDQYLGERAEQRVQIKPSLVQSLYFKIRNLNEIPSDLWFDEVQQYIYDKMEHNPDYLPAFKKSKIYIKLLQELDLIQQTLNEYDSISLNSDENLEITITESKIENTNLQTTKPLEDGAYLCISDNIQKSQRHMRSFSDVDVVVFTENDKVAEPKISPNMVERASSADDNNLVEKNLRSENYTLTVKIIETGIVSEKGKTFGIYAIQVSRQHETGFLEEWHIYRRYSDFHDLYTKVKEKYPDLSKLTFPGKKTFHNMDRSVLEKRMKMLGNYMNEICNPAVISSHNGLKQLLMTFLEQGEYDKATGGPISTTINNLVNPIKTGMKTIKNMPEQLINTVDEVVGGITKVFNNKQGRSTESSKVGASIEETDDNIPLRIFLLLMDEVFDLKSRNQWLRRRIITLVRQFIRTMFGDIVNRKILDYVSVMTSPKNVAHYLSVFKQSIWPNGNKYEKRPDRDEHTKNRTRVAAKGALLSCLSDELKHIVGSETTRRGLMTVFELFQNPTLNKRLLFVLLESILITLFPEKDMNKIICTLHSRSQRYQCHLKNKKLV